MGCHSIIAGMWDPRLRGALIGCYLKRNIDITQSRNIILQCNTVYWEHLVHFTQCHMPFWCVCKQWVDKTHSKSCILIYPSTKGSEITLNTINNNLPVIWWAYGICLYVLGLGEWQCSLITRQVNPVYVDFCFLLLANKVV